MPKRSSVKKVKRSNRRGGRARGAGFFGDLWSGVKKVAGVVNDGLKETKLLSGFLLPKVPYVGDLAAGFVRNHGYGKRRVRRTGGALAVTRT